MNRENALEQLMIMKENTQRIKESIAAKGKNVTPKQSTMFIVAINQILALEYAIKVIKGEIEYVK